MTTADKNFQCHPQRSVHTLCLAACLGLWLSGCSSSTPEHPPSMGDSQAPYQQGGETSSSEQQAQRNDLEYNLQRLDDRDYTQTYGDGENEKIWYSAAENLGSIGKPAIPHLIAKLDSDDQFEVMLALYALQLASQDEQLRDQIGQNYLALPSVLNPRANAHNKAIALSWWQEYRHLWD